MALATYTVIREGGSEVVVRDGEVIARTARAVAGIVSDASPFECHGQLEELHRTAASFGVEIGYPRSFRGILELTAIPDHGMSEHGLVDTTSHAVLDVLLDDAVPDPVRGRC